MPAVILAAVLAAATTAAAPDTTGSAGKVARVCLIDVDRVGAQSLLGKRYAAKVKALKDELDAERTKKQVELQKMDAEIKALQEDLEKQGAFLSEDALEKKRQEITRKGRDRQAFVDDGTAEIERRRERAQTQGDTWSNEMRARIQPHVEAVARQQGFNILLDARNALALDGSFDISSDVIVRLDEAERVSPAASPVKPSGK
jgi:Skp family chaperone for outer membrane proteins